MRLDLLHPRTPPLQLVGTPAPEDGVGPDAPSPGVTPEAPARHRPGWRGWLAILAVACSLLGQGERSRIDPRFQSPSRTLLTYWEALREGDADAVRECYSAERTDLPVPGALWFMPPTDDLWLTAFRSLPVTAGRVLVRYEVHFKPKGSGQEQMFETGSELVRARGQWRIAQPLGAASMPEWKPVPGPVDI